MNAPLLDLTYPHPRLIIAGRCVEQARDSEPVLNPATGETLGEVPHATDADLAEALDAAARAFPAWRDTAPPARGRIIRAAATLLRERRTAIATLITLEMGKPYQEALAEIETAAGIFEWHAGEGERAYGRVIPGGAPGERRLVLRSPLGPIAAFSSWNAPSITPSRKISGALAAGCPVIIKASEESPATALAVAQCLLDAGLPPELLSVVFGDPAWISQRLIEDPVIRGVTFTGSVGVGKKIAALALSGMKRTTLELGGHAPVIIWDDVDVDAVAKASSAAKFRNVGQVCTSPTRFYVHERVYDRFRDGVVAAAKAIRVGDGFDPATAMGPLANARRVTAMMELTEEARSRGVTIAAGSSAPQSPGFFWNPTVLDDAREDCLAANAEPFGPLALLRPVGSVEEALALANRLPLGLASYVMARDGTVANRLADGIEAGNVAVNSWRASLPESPFGGWKESGLGQEGGIEGLEAFQSVKCELQA
ncbi:succinate-semialdehyde dehydrogenase / glutarate-semialdehyde dehydrogenase [Roseomonas rosea]|uniref:Succinate-semialdehyde dehydrogenase / glutarate-semialdehyde dehydrogenase n=1 Tax=Muricoccus roseus TaxID=198092 RepID=A0A1M6PZJ0_9PROT|nr:NAD-dependent succinate-semialdehyde dehydrogenase [Roseomonas rosea]SHK13358.1 succinate-semialdehyde dehydrogenase / glutarate-semialdehyde dehydrogenase [Roseomonas rosea]